MTTSRPAANNYPGSPFVGREAELAALREALKSALDGHGRIMLVTGEPGIGKTRTAEEILAEAREGRAEVLWGRCQEWEGAPAYWPWLQILRRYVERTDEETIQSDLTGIASDLTQIMPELERLGDPKQSGAATSPEQRRFRLFDAMARLLRTVSNRQPVVLVLDDVHWADQPSLRLLEFVAQDVHELPLLLIATYRNVELDRGHPLTGTLAELSRDPASRRIILHGLGSDAVSRYIELTAEREPPPGLVDAVLEETEGNPFFMTEVVGWLRSEDRLMEGIGDGAWTIRIPESVREAIGNRLDRLSHESNEVLTIAAVIGREFQLQLLARAAEIETLELLDRLDEAVQAGVLEELDQPGDYCFSHALIQETLYDELTTSRRIRLHATVGIALESLIASDLAPYYAELARHFSEAALAGNADKAIEYATRAGDQAMESTAWEAAAGHYLQAVEIMEMSPQADPRRQARMLIQIGRALHLSGAALFSSDAAVAFDRAINLARSHHLTEEFIEAVLDRAGTNLAIQYGGAEHVRLLEDALELLEPGDSALRARLLTRLAVDQRALPDYQESTVKQIADEALAMARRVDDASVLANALIGHAVANWGPDKLAVRTHSINELLALHDAVSLPHADLYWGYGLQAAYALESGDLDLAGQALSSLAELAAQTPIRWARTFLNELRVVRALLVEDLPGAESAAEESTESKTQIEMIPWHLQHFLVLRREQDRLNELEEELSSIVSLLEQPIDDMPWHGLWPELRYYRIQLLIMHHMVTTADLDNRFRALTHEYLTNTERDLLWSISGCLLAEVCVAIGEHAVAPSVYDVLLPYAERVAVSGLGPFCTIPASVAHYLGLIATMLGRWSDAERHFETASAVQAEMPTSLAHTWHARASMLVKRSDPGDIDRARELNNQALTAARELGMVRLERLARALADEIETRDTGSVDGAAYDLTPRELEVLGCLVRGSTDREIADELSISHRTVQVHVSRILGKLDAGSRTAAAALAIREGLV